MTERGTQRVQWMKKARKNLTNPEKPFTATDPDDNLNLREWSPFFPCKANEHDACCEDSQSSKWNLDNTKETSQGISDKENDMPNRIRERARIGDKTIWLTGSNPQELFDRYVEKLIAEGVLQQSGQAMTKTPPFGRYCIRFNEQFKSGQQSLTIRSRDQITHKHLLPRFGETPIGEITTGDLQQWFDEMCRNGYARETLLKIKNTMSPVFDSAVEDGLITKNPFHSRRFQINTDKGGHHKAMPDALIRSIRANLTALPPDQRRMIALLSYTGLRMEEVLGLRWEDLNVPARQLQVLRAVVHPERNMPEVKVPKTVSSQRCVPVTDKLIAALQPIGSSGFILGGDKPLSYTVMQRMFRKAREALGFQGYSAHDFRATCATQWREAGMGIDIVKNMLGHGNSAVTEKCYVKYRRKSLDEARAFLEAM